MDEVEYEALQALRADALRLRDLASGVLLRLDALLGEQEWEAKVPALTRLISWGSKVDTSFKAGVLWIEEQIGLSADKLMNCMAFETGQTFRADIKNLAGSSGLGLIQFMKATIEGKDGLLAKYPNLKKVAPTHAALAKLTPTQQLTFVYYYFKAFGSDLSGWSQEDIYMAILYPKAIGKPLDWVMPWEYGSLAYKQNSGLDIDKDRKITKAEAAYGVTRMAILGEQLKG